MVSISIGYLDTSLLQIALGQFFSGSPGILNQI